MKNLKRLSLVMAFCATFATGAAHAGIPTVDIAKFAADAVAWKAQLDSMVKTVKFAEDQYKELQETVKQARNTADALKGGRSMGALLNDVSGRQTVSADFEQLVTNLRKLGAAGAGAQAKSIYDSIKSFDCTAQFGKNADARKQCEARALVIPTVVANLNESLARSKARAEQLQAMVAKVDTDDMKAAADLQARMGVEIAMLNNEAMIASNAREQLRAQAELNLQAAREASLKRMAVDQGGTNPFGK